MLKSLQRDLSRYIQMSLMTRLYILGSFKVQIVTKMENTSNMIR